MTDREKLIEEAGNFLNKEYGMSNGHPIIHSLDALKLIKRLKAALQAAEQERQNMHTELVAALEAAKALINTAEGVDGDIFHFSVLRRLPEYEALKAALKATKEG